MDLVKMEEAEVDRRRRERMEHEYRAEQRRQHKAQEERERIAGLLTLARVGHADALRRLRAGQRS